MFIVKLFEDLSKDFSQLLDASDDYDVVIQAGEISDFKEFKAHSNVLRARSPYFKAALSNQWANPQSGVTIFKKSNISSDVFRFILCYIYTGIIDLTDQSSSNILSLLVASDELMLDKLVDQIQKHVRILTLTFFKLQSCTTLQDHIMKTICKNPKPFLELEEFPNLDKDIFLKLVERDDLDIEEIDIWKYLIKWGKASISSNKKSMMDVTKWEKSDFALFKKSLDPFIPHIRLHEISSEEFFHHVRPYKKAIPKDLYEDLMAYQMANITPKVSKLHPRYGSINIDSAIIEKDKAAIIINWIEKRTIFSRKPFYQFTLTYRATRDGFEYNKFIANNNSSGAIIGLIKIKDSKKIIGGYNPLGLRNNNNRYSGSNRYRQQWESTNDSFIFCFGDEEGSDVHILSRVKNSSYAIYNYNGYWMNFGNSDLLLNGGSGSCSQSYYENTILDTNSFVVEELETFVVSQTI
ncbi:8271_t:CDS:2 [Cetraspora pellucida]|uniref:8271_t:CDS:1 n=1 Tax=Cetraspora pellucida TaxID=1433469 RepID=A0A9N9IYV3_9GLOM|nr:8271_t:CDS:2 [Cetraspora pellucida]